MSSNKAAIGARILVVITIFVISTKEKSKFNYFEYAYKNHPVKNSFEFSPPVPHYFLFIFCFGESRSSISKGGEF
ncbi:hypothetical protein IX39_16970 [Chryseobacterium formosense]|uniref:Uncharacterized protein n=1 Tax=Chryseobacterium formosense TaxID=236814 RepID=A0A085Z0X3_9FLAO|nr:hypothetical protein IX39_16970 [Chryseobacterium formosense]